MEFSKPAHATPAEGATPRVARTGAGGWERRSARAGRANREDVALVGWHMCGIGPLAHRNCAVPGLLTQDV